MSELFRGVADWFRGLLWTPDGEHTFFSNACVTAFIVVGFAWLLRYTLREAERWYAGQEQQLASLFPTPWQVISGGRKIDDLEFASRVLPWWSRTSRFRCRPLLEREEPTGKAWLFVKDVMVSGGHGKVGMAVCVIRRHNWDWPRLILLNRVGESPGESLTGQFTPQDFQDQWADLCGQWNISAEGDETSGARFLQSTVDLLLSKPATELRRIDMGGQYLACVGSAADPPESFPDVLKRAERLAQRLDRLCKDS